MAQRKGKGAWGGRRAGAGRKAILHDRVRFLVDLEREQLEWLRQTAKDIEVSVSELVRWMVATRMKRGRRK